MREVIVYFRKIFRVKNFDFIIVDFYLVYNMMKFVMEMVNELDVEFF